VRRLIKTRLLNIVRQLLRSIRRRRGNIQCEAFMKDERVTARVLVYSEIDRNIIKRRKTPCMVRLKPGYYYVRVSYMSYLLERDVEIKDGETVKAEFRFPGGILECKAYEGEREVRAIVEILNMESGEVVARRATPFTIHLEAGRYTLKAMYTSVKEG